MGIVYEAYDPTLGRRIALKTIQLAFPSNETDREAFEKRFLTEARAAAALQHPVIVVVHYEAYDPDLERLVGLKTISLSFELSDEYRAAFEERFFAEARIAARLNHPGTVVVHDVGRDEESGTLFIVLEYLQGQTLAELAKEGVPVEWAFALHVTSLVAEALHYAHSEKVIHRDIKPANIMILPSGEPKVMDFGIAKIETARLRLTMHGQFFGTPLYMAPEQALGHKLDLRVDIFALGAVAYELLTGQLAFGAPTLARIIGRVVAEDPIPPTRIIPVLPPDVDYVIARRR